MWCHQPRHLARECVNPRAYSSDIPDDGPADTPLVATRSEVAQPTPPADSYNVCNDSATSVSSPVLLDSADVGTAMEENISPAGFSCGEDDISDSFSVDLITIKVVLIKNVMLRKVMLILSKIRGILNKVVMWNIVGVM